MIFIIDYTRDEGGGREKEEAPVETMNREFEEETGSSIKFTDDADHCFSFIDFLKPTEIRMISVYCRLTSDVDMFNSILKNFHSGTNVFFSRAH